MILLKSQIMIKLWLQLIHCSKRKLNFNKKRRPEIRGGVFCAHVLVIKRVKYQIELSQ